MTRTQLRTLTLPGASLGFRLAGLRVDEITRGEAPAHFRNLVADPAVGVIALDERLLPLVPADVALRLARTGVPVMLPFGVPERLSDAGRGEAYVAALIRRAIGYHVKVPTRSES